MVQAQRDGLGSRPGALIAGHQKDLVLTGRLWSEPGRVAIYGWPRPTAPRARRPVLSARP
jgi:hypothetical protein